MRENGKRRGRKGEVTLSGCSIIRKRDRVKAGRFPSRTFPYTPLVSIIMRRKKHDILNLGEWY